jgi:protein-S-isoprenylcysteine O-methyltransferase Ste14
MTVWFGWSTYRGSARAAVAGVLWLTMLSTVAIPFEERKLERAFGEAYRAYHLRVPRWL